MLTQAYMPYKDTYVQILPQKYANAPIPPAHEGGRVHEIQTVADLRDGGILQNAHFDKPRWRAGIWPVGAGPFGNFNMNFTALVFGLGTMGLFWIGLWIGYQSGHIDGRTKGRLEELETQMRAGEK